MTDCGDISAGDANILEEVVGSGRPQNIGAFRFWFADQRWEWSDEVAAMHGYEPGQVRPTTELLLSHKHPEDRAQVAQTIARALQHNEPFSSRHRIIDTAGTVHEVIVVGDCFTEGAGVVGTGGYYIDVTGVLAEHRQQTLDDELPELYETRAEIEQAKGALMVVYGLGAEPAFRLLTWRSQETNVKVRALAAQLVAEMSRGEWVGQPRTRIDHLLLTVHERVAGR
ncbi:PAS and ANTAR domain-containing protein [Nocardia sp. NEAU-G5]|uniref:histidine kinase n=1 Tax=Nocardia albiluteola TaxID=2842303 RepID=A0ABS6B8E7_9NOCA|nr:PAS and ANTAR domain-containing protein [Nocardia albiluteola]MBU3066001.1 PAS and ANTAR domain-containing protein [Nocardia albiluteola]